VAVHLRIQPRAHRRNRHPGKFEVPAMGKGYIGVVDALVHRPERLALLEAHIAAISLPRWGLIDGRPSPNIILRPRHRRLRRRATDVGREGALPL
jgi:hypothetical protein